MNYKFISKAIVTCILSIVTTMTIVACTKEEISDNKEDIHSKIYSIFSEMENQPSEENPEDNLRKEKNAIGIEKFCDFEYNDNIYISTAHAIDESMLDMSQNIGEVCRYDDSSQKTQAYVVNNVNPMYMLAAKVDSVYVLYYNRTCSHENMQEYIDLIGPQEALQVEYVKVELLDNESVKKQITYYDDIEEWAWQLLLGNEHKKLNHVSGIQEIPDSVDSEERANIVICIRNKYTGAEYLSELHSNGNLIICDVYSVYEHRYEYDFTEEELIDALEKLVENRM